MIWVHDYHLMLVPKMIRDKIPDAKIGFFLHVAFPSSEVFRCLAVRKQLLEGILGSCLVGFQTKEYTRHFLQTCSRILYVEATTTGVQLEDRFVHVTSLPIGIDPTSLGLRRKESSVEDWIKIIKERYRGKKLIVARDKVCVLYGPFNVAQPTNSLLVIFSWTMSEELGRSCLLSNNSSINIRSGMEGLF